jgi:hypothetical protein
MGLPRVAVAIGEDAEAFGAADAVLDGDPEAGEAAVVVLLLVGEGAALGLPVGDVEVRVILVVALSALSAWQRARLGKVGPARRSVRS